MDTDSLAVSTTTTMSANNNHCTSMINELAFIRHNLRSSTTLPA
jgi:hypothetical protein